MALATALQASCTSERISGNPIPQKDPSTSTQDALLNGFLPNGSGFNLAPITSLPISHATMS